MHGPYWINVKYLIRHPRPRSLHAIQVRNCSLELIRDSAWIWFRGSLREIGLPQTELVTGLLFFNLGVEIGQVAFAVAAIGFLCVAQRYVSAISQAEVLRRTSAYLIGAVGMFWVFERSAAF